MGWLKGRVRKVLAVGVVLGCAGLMASACGSTSSSSSTTTSPSGTSGTKAPVKVGYLVPLTGAFTTNGKTEQDGYKLGLKTFATTVGGNPTVDGHPIDTTFVTTGSTSPTVALSQAKLLVGRHVQVMEGPLVSNQITVVSPYVMSQGIIEDDLYLATPQQVSDYSKYGLGFTSGWNGLQPMSEGGSWAYKTMGWRHVTTVGLDISYGWQGIGGFDAAFTKLGGKIDKAIWVPLSTVSMASFISEIPSTTQAVIVVFSGQQAAHFVNTYKSYGLSSKIPLAGITTLTGQSALPAINKTAALGVHTFAQYCTGISSSVNQKFATAFKKDYGRYPSYYADAGYTKAEILVKALQSLNGKATTEKTLAKAMRSVTVTAPRGPVSFSTVTWSPIQNGYICQVKTVSGELRNVPIKTYTKTQPWGALSQSTFETVFTQTSKNQPSF